MSLKSVFLDIIHRLDPNPVRPAAAEFPDEEVSRAFMEAIRDRRAFKLERDCYKAELLKLGYTEASLAKRVQVYGGQLLGEVKAARA
jgi:phosphoribosylpyrophosphate synthetase